VKLAALAGSDLTARGYHAQVHAQDDSLALFHLERRPPRDPPAGRPLRRRRSAVSAAHAGDAGDGTPAGFSPNVLLRPIVQDTLSRRSATSPARTSSPTSASSAACMPTFGVPMPLFYPRATATILDSAALRFLTKYKLPLEALQAQDEAALNELLKTQIPPVVDEAFVASAQAIDTQMTRLIQTLPSLDPTLEGAARSTLERMQRDLQTLHGKMIQAAKRRDETLRRQFIHARRSPSRAATPRSGPSGSSRSSTSTARRSSIAGRRAAARPRSSLDRHDLGRVDDDREPGSKAAKPRSLTHHSASLRALRSPSSEASRPTNIFVS
jgi:hypothetical protein